MTVRVKPRRHVVEVCGRHEEGVGSSQGVRENGKVRRG